MDLFFAGAEHPTYLRKLIDLGVTTVAISYHERRERYSTERLVDRLPADMRVCITPGVARKEALDYKRFVDDYIGFCEKNADTATIYDLDAPHCPLPERQRARDALSFLPNMVAFPFADETLEGLARTHERLGVNARLSKATPGTELRRIAASLYGSNVSSQNTLRVGRFTATTSHTWLSGKRYGEVWVYSRGRMHHYVADKLERAVRAHKGDIEDLGVDPAGVLANDPDALIALAVRSFQRMSEGLSKRPRDRQIIEASGTSTGTSAPTAALIPLPHPDASLPPAPIEREREVLPILGVYAQDGRPLAQTSQATVRQCDSCHLSDYCPKYLEGHACSFSIPIEIRTNEQWEAATQALLEFQFERATFSHFADQLQGGPPSARTGQEMDRFNKMLGSIKDLKREPPPEGLGVLSRALGKIKAPDMQGEPDGPEEASEADEDDIEEAIVVGDLEDWEAGGPEDPDEVG